MHSSAFCGLTLWQMLFKGPGTQNDEAQFEIKEQATTKTKHVNTVMELRTNAEDWKRESVKPQQQRRLSFKGGGGRGLSGQHTCSRTGTFWNRTSKEDTVSEGLQEHRVLTVGKGNVLLSLLAVKLSGIQGPCWWLWVLPVLGLGLNEARLQAERKGTNERQRTGEQINQAVTGR